MTPHNNMPEPFILGTRGGYAAGSFKLSVETVAMNMLANTFMRAPGESVGTFALESAIDELAVELALDPVELRLRNEPEKDPTSGLPFSSPAVKEAPVSVGFSKTAGHALALDVHHRPRPHPAWHRSQ